MTRKRIVIVFVLLLIIGGLFLYSEYNQKPSIQGVLSQRSKEFLDSQKNSANSNLKDINLSGPQGEDTRNKRIGRENCYSFVIPYRVAITKIEDVKGNECYARFTFDSPKGAIVVYKTVKSVSSWDDIPAVIQRRRDTDEYLPEEEKILGGKKFLMFRIKGESYEKNVFYIAPSYFLVFNLLTRANENLDSDLDRMLSSLEIE